MTQLDSRAADIAQQLNDKVLRSVGAAVIGKDMIIQKMIVCLLAGGHVLLEDVPGIGKTTIVHAIAHAVDLRFRRTQFTPDLMPSDLTGFNIYNPKTSEFQFQEGAVNTQILLADEINRTSPRTQSALLEAMQEGQVTVEGKTYPLPQPFMVMATQNPIEHSGTYPLPEAQLDRFMMRLSIGYPSFEEEMQIVDSNVLPKMDEVVQVVASEQEIRWIKDQVNLVETSDSVKRYVLQLCRATRQHPDIELGVSPRAGQMLLRAASALALINGRGYVIPDDVQIILHDVLDHRIILKPQARGRDMTAGEIVENILQQTVAPR
ncbi:MAG: MoxR family ATPase [Peptoniphilaceae bacterium]|nr:AAA family ATPase [Peptoniphilaceae bacterium]MCI6659606.1 AAA family ATPase [Peptoniphilaceae bacterium]MDD7434730.1 MoxR family ATPase [Peptoniphilaceae bacterium]MDY3075743.1 MoxR family ATPase [Peptoniphilaceae bacterium]MDY4196827.1 MoxR family ATPase [Peptoniphilaceae bacterium]